MILLCPKIPSSLIQRVYNGWAFGERGVIATAPCAGLSELPEVLYPATHSFFTLTQESVAYFSAGICFYAHVSRCPLCA